MKTAVKKNMIYNNYIIHVFNNINIIIHVYMQEDKLFCQKTEYNLIMKIAHPDIRFRVMYNHAFTVLSLLNVNLLK